MENIIAIATVCVTLLLGILGFIVNSMVQRKSNSISVITNTRLERRRQTQELASILLHYSDADYLATVGKDKRAGVVSECAKSVAALRSLYTFTVKEDQCLVRKAEALKESICRSLDGMEAAETGKKRAEFEQVMDVYVATEWKRIKMETVGKGKKGSKSYSAWQKQWEKYEKKYEKKYREHMGKRERVK